MIIFLYGPDSYRRAYKEREIIDAYHSKHGSLSSAWFDLGEKNGLDGLKEFLANSSMFEPDKLAVIEQPFKAAAGELQDALKPYLDNGTKTTILIVSESKAPAKLSFLISKPSRSQEFGLLSGKELENFILKEAEDRGVKLKTGVVGELAQGFGGDTWSIVTELDKLVLMKKQVVEAKALPNYYELINGLKYGRDIRSRVVALELILSERKDDAARVFNSIAYKLKSAREAVLLADYDVAVKSGKLDYEEVLLDLALGSQDVSTTIL